MTQTKQIRPAPRVIQGGMGAGVSNWRLARRVAELGGLGVVSATGIDTILVRELQQGDPHGRLAVLASYPDRAIVAELSERFFVEGGIADGAPFKLLPIHGFKPSVRSQRILAAAAYSEVALAKRGHEGQVGINLLTKLKRHSLASIYGALLAGVDAVLMGAGIPLEEAAQIPRLAAGEPGRLRLEVDTSAATDPTAEYFYDFDPRCVTDPPPVLQRPAFYPIISSDLLARVLAKKLPREGVTGWIIETPIAGGHNAPPRGKQYDEQQNPVYDSRDQTNLDAVAALGYPFYLAGGYATPEKLREALAAGAAGVQVGSLFSLADESGYPADYKRRLIEAIHRKEVSIRTDGRISPTGFPFKVVESRGVWPPVPRPEERRRICDLGYLQTAVVDGNGRLQGRCPAEPVDTYVRKGGEESETVRRGCLCNGLMANIGVGQRRSWGEEPPLFTAGDEILHLSLGSIETPHYAAADVMDYLQAAEAAT